MLITLHDTSMRQVECYPYLKMCEQAGALKKPVEATELDRAGTQVLLLQICVLLIGLPLHEMGLIVIHSSYHTVIIILIYVCIF